MEERVLNILKKRRAILILDLLKLNDLGVVDKVFKNKIDKLLKQVSLDDDIPFNKKL